MSPEEYELKKTDISETNPSNAEGANVSELDKFFDNDSIKANQEIIEGVLNKAENKSLKEGFENFLLNEKNTIKKNAIKLKLSKATDELTVKSIIAEVVEGGYKVGDKKNVGEDTGKGENVKEGESIGGEKPAENQNGNLEDALQQTVQKEEEAVQKEEEAVQKEEEARTDTEQAKEIMEEAKKYNDDLNKKYPELAKKANERYNDVKTQLENNGTLNQLRKSNHDEEFINNYILVQTTLTELKSNPTNYEQSDISNFDKIVKNLNNACNIPDTSLSSFSTENIAQTRTELFHSEIGNDSLIQTKKSNLESHDYTDLFPDKSEKELINEYGKFLNNEQIKNLIVKYNNESLTDEEKNYLIFGCKRAKEQIDNKTKDMVEELCLISQIKGMYMCMGEGADFNLNKAREIESENGILTLRGHIDGVEFAIRQDTNNPEAKLQTSTKLAKERNNKDDTNKSENFIVGGKDNFVDSNFILQSQEEIFESIKGTINDTIKSDELFKISNNSEEYLKNLQTNIMGKLEEKYEKTKYAQHYMKEQVKGEKIIDKTISFIEKIKDSELDAEVNNSKTQLYDFLNLMDFNVRYSTSAEKDKFYRVMDRVDRMLEQAKDDPTDGELRDHNDKFGQYLTGNTFLNTRNVLNNKMVGGESAKYAFDLFKNYKIEGDERKNGELFMINFDKMLNDLNEVEQDKKDAESLANIESNLYGAYGDLTLSYA